MPCAARATVRGQRRAGDTGAEVRDGICGLLSQPAAAGFFWSGTACTFAGSGANGALRRGISLVTALGGQLPCAGEVPRLTCAAKGRGRIFRSDWCDRFLLSDRTPTPRAR